MPLLSALFFVRYYIVELQFFLFTGSGSNIKFLCYVGLEAIKPKALMAKLDIDKTPSDGAVGEWLRQVSNRLEEKLLKKRKMAEKRAAVKAGNI